MDISKEQLKGAIRRAQLGSQGPQALPFVDTTPDMGYKAEDGHVYHLFVRPFYNEDTKMACTIFVPAVMVEHDSAGLIFPQEPDLKPFVKGEVDHAVRITRGGQEVGVWLKVPFRMTLPTMLMSPSRWVEMSAQVPLERWMHITRATLKDEGFQEHLQKHAQLWEDGYQNDDGRDPARIGQENNCRQFQEMLQEWIDQSETSNGASTASEGSGEPGEESSEAEPSTETS